ncbi:hypothetical protein [Chryseobacterium sp. MEBOG07]|uniref:hypothetical protein n=1 Tax=Chryseobacterium sp. MEBOG07 TaxID=2879939 RepID=UPI001F3456AD|nr:hypothetical protein [Chryseobacterium sp. MEBOG07]UKB81246.1 hypothetical protein LF886_09725 [Chryseobacterium sp. MEBOG07]
MTPFPKHTTVPDPETERKISADHWHAQAHTDNIKDDGSGNDSFSINISGETILPPSVYKIVPTFKVLFFIPPII